LKEGRRVRVFTLSHHNSVFPNATVDSPNGLALRLKQTLWSKITLQPLSESLVKSALERGTANWVRQTGEEVVSYSLLGNPTSCRCVQPSYPVAHLLWVRVNSMRKGGEFIVHYGDVPTMSVYSQDNFEPMVYDIVSHLRGLQDVYSI